MKKRKKESSFSLFLVFLVSFCSFERRRYFCFFFVIFHMWEFFGEKASGECSIPPFFLRTQGTHAVAHQLLLRRLLCRLLRFDDDNGSVVLILLLFPRAWKRVQNLSLKEKENWKRIESERVIPITFCRRVASDASRINSLTNAFILFIFSIKPAK